MVVTFTLPSIALLLYAVNAARKNAPGRSEVVESNDEMEEIAGCRKRLWVTTEELTRFGIALRNNRLLTPDCWLLASNLAVLTRLPALFIIAYLLKANSSVEARV